MAEIKIKKRDSLIVWKEPVKKPVRDMRVTVEDGCVAVCSVGGAVINEFYPGDRKLLNEGNMLVKAYGKRAEIALYVFNNRRPVEVKWGIGRMPASYPDKRIGGIPLSVTAYGRCTILVTDARLLLNKMPESAIADGEVTPDEIVEFVQRDIISKVGPILSAELLAIGDYTLVRGRLESLADRITYGIRNMENLGLRVSDTVVENLDYTEDAKAVIEKYERGLIEPLNTRVAAEKAKQIKVMAEARAKRE
ncbi:MAG: SPFH domain-containing protein [Clostridiales bacterium]|jgi:hypothetical protein|nr:SPFH domain-containing protein [Clostridiales bacterium]